MASKRKLNPTAIITIRRPGKMTARGRRDIAAWLKKHAAYLLKHGKDYTEGTFTGRFIYR